MLYLEKHANTEWGIRLWSDWSSTRAVTAVEGTSRVCPSTPLLEMPIEDLAYWLGKFVLEVPKQNGKEYPLKMLYCLICCFKRYFEQNGVHDVNPLD